MQLDPIPRRSGRKRKSSGLYSNAEFLSDDEEDEFIEMAKRQRVHHLTGFDETRPELQRILSLMRKHPNAWPFNYPVDPVALGLPDYFDRIKKPMDFSTVQKKLDSGQYMNSEEFADDVRLIFTNCWTYNLPDSDIYFMAHTLSKLFEKELKKIKQMETNVTAKSEFQEMQDIISDLRNEHQKLLQELHKLVKDQKALTFTTTHPTTSNRIYSPVQRRQGSIKAKKTPKGKKGRFSKSKMISPSFSLEQKEILSNNISALTPENLQRMVEILSQEMPQLVKNGQIEIDLEQLGDATLNRLDEFVNNCLIQQQQPKQEQEQQPEQQQSIPISELTSSMKDNPASKNEDEKIAPLVSEGDKIGIALKINEHPKESPETSSDSSESSSESDSEDERIALQCS